MEKENTGRLLMLEQINKCVNVETLDEIKSRQMMTFSDVCVIVDAIYSFGQRIGFAHMM